MASSLFTSPLYLLSFTLLVQIALGTDPLFHSCSSSGNFTAYSPYEANLNKLIDYLDSAAPPTGFASGSAGLRSYDQATYGLSLCRGDVNATECRTCLAEAGREVRKLCPYNDGATIWYDKCELKYSNVDFFGKIDNQIRFCMCGLQSVSDPIYFKEQTKELLGKLAEEASHSPKMYAAGELELKDYKKLYWLVQCTRDLSSTDCKYCIDEAISQLPRCWCCDGKEGARVVRGSCNVRYEIYPFLNV